MNPEQHQKTSGAAPALKHSDSIHNIRPLQDVMDRLVEKAIRKYIDSDKVLTQSQHVYIMLRQELDDSFLRSLKPYLCQQMKFLLSKCHKIEEGKHEKLMAWRTFEDLIEEFRSLHRNKHTRPDIWKTLSWLGYSACGGIQGCLLQVDKKKLGVKESPSRKKNSTRKDKISLRIRKKTPKKMKIFSYNKTIRNYHVGIRMFLYQFIVLLDRCKTDQLIEDIKNSLKPIYTSKSKILRDQLELTMENFRSLLRLKISDPSANDIDGEIIAKLINLEKFDRDEYDKIEDLTNLVEKVNSLIPT